MIPQNKPFLLNFWSLYLIIDFFLLMLKESQIRLEFAN